jgi:hypothetical protein
MNTLQDPEAAETVQTTSSPAVDLPRLVRLFLSGQAVSRYGGSGDRSEPMHWLHVTWVTADIKSDRAATWWGFGSAFINDRIVFEILRRPEQWEILLPNADVEASVPTRISDTYKPQ